MNLGSWEGIVATTIVTTGYENVFIMSASKHLKEVGQAQHAAKAAEAKLLFHPSVGITASMWSPDSGVSWKDDPTRKLIHFVRHGQGYHNLLGEVCRQNGAEFSETGDYELAIAEKCPYMLPGIQDPPLTAIGRKDATFLRNIAPLLHVELLVSSLLRRATETILIGFKNCVSNGVPIVAHEGCREQCGVFLCDRRSHVSDYTEDPRYGAVDYTLLGSDEDSMWKPTRRETMLEMTQRAESFLLWLRNRPEREIVVGTHSAWLMAVFNIILQYDQSVNLDYATSMFETGEMRSLVLRWGS